MIHMAAESGQVAAVEADRATGPSSQTLSWWRLAAFGLPAVPYFLITTPSTILLAPFFTTEMGVTLTAWAAIIAISRLVDVATDPLVGLISDVLPSRWGRRRHWLVLSAPFVMLGTALIFTPRLFVGQGRVTFWYVVVGFLLMNLSNTIYNLNATAWGGELSTSYGERTRIMGARALTGGAARVAAFALPAALEWLAPHARLGDKLALVMWTAVVLTPICTIVAVLAVGENPGRGRAETRRAGMGFAAISKALWRLLSNRYLGWVLLIDLLLWTPTAIKAAIFVFYVKDILRAPQITATLLLGIFVAATISTPLFIWIARGREKHRVLAGAGLVYAISQATMIFWGPQTLGWFIVFIVLSGVVVTGPSFLVQSMMADVTDSHTAKGGADQAGLLFSLLETTYKLAPSLAVVILYPLLQSTGYNPASHHNSRQSLDALRYLFAFAPGAPVLFCAYLLWTFPLTSKAHSQFRSEIDRGTPAA
jgi:glycoside/pentoside/hexuronide:cation symporter, GPH family